MVQQSRALVVAAAAVAALTISSAASSAVGTDTSALREAVTTAGIMEHQEEFQAIASANPVNGVPTRAVETPGYDASVEYVAGLLEDAGYDVAIQDFTYEAFIDVSPPVFERVSPDPEAYVNGFDGDFLTMTWSGTGDVTAELVAVGGIVIPSPGGSASGCEPGDFAGFPDGAIALIQRGTCPFRQKVTNAEDAGADGVVIFNEGNVDPSDDRIGVINGTLDPPATPAEIPVIGTSFAVGEELYELTLAGEVVVHLAVNAALVEKSSSNVIADTPGGREDRTVVVGAHLDSVPEGPGINDNGSGSSTILEVALQMAELEIEPVNQVRFAFWGAEEEGLVGSQLYVDSLAKSELKDIMLNLNLDMVGSPNFVRFVYDGDGSAFGTDGPSGSGTIEDVFTDYFASLGLATEETEFDGRSDYDAFISAGIPAGGLFTGAEGIKTAEQARIYGGAAGTAYDPCYHLLCDDITNLSLTALAEMSDATAHAVLTFAMTKSSVNGTDNASNRAKDNMQFKASFAKK
jgi:Zn-dependent M28 family amino/carboxypeptidase